MGCSGQVEVPKERPETVQDVAIAAIKAGDEARVAELLDAYPGLESAFDTVLQTPLHYAVAGNHTGIVKLLIGHGADVNAVNDDGERPLAVAETYGASEEIFDLLLSAGARE